MNQNINYQHEIQTNPLVRLQMTDPNLITEMMKTQDPKNAEVLMKKKLEQIGLDEKEIAIIFMSHGEKYPLQKAMSATGLSESELNTFYDSAMVKISNAINGNGFMDNLKALFGK